MLLVVVAQDTLIIYNGNSTSASVLREFHNVTQPPADLYNSNSTLTLKLKDESGDAEVAFRIRYSALPTACDPSRWGSIQLTATGQVKTLGFRMGHYDADLCTWRITGPPNTAVRISEINRYLFKFSFRYYFRHPDIFILTSTS